MTLPLFSRRSWLVVGFCGLTFWGAWVPSTAMAWTRMGESEEVTLYLNRNSIEKENTIRRVREMQDLKTADAEGVRSRSYINEYDCNYKMHRLGQMTSYAGPKMTGQKLFTVDEMGYWRKIPPDGVFVLTYIAVCIQ
jgi:hypothetical protein